MKRLSIKIIVALVGVFFAVTTLLRRILLLGDHYPNFAKVASAGAFVAMLLAGFLSLTAFAIVINLIIVKRIKKLNTAVKEIENGKYDIDVKIKGNDEIGTLRDNINSMAKELHANEYLSKNFVKNFSHELKTPLSSIKGYTELIADEKLTKDEVKEYSGIIIGQIDKLTSLSKSMLQLSLLDSSELVVKNKTFSVDEQIRNVLQLTQLSWEKKDIKFDLRLEDVSITGNKELTQQIWQNLISNAIKFSNIGGEIRIVLFKTERVHFEIQDFGQGISEENKKNIFNQFYIADKSRNKSGSGLGLSIVQKILEKLDGEISFISKKDRGTSFYVSLG